MLLLPFILSNLFSEEVDVHNLHHRCTHVIEPSEELIGVTNIFLYTLFHLSTPGKTPTYIGNLFSLSHRYINIIFIVIIISIKEIMCDIYILLIILFISGCWMNSKLSFYIAIG